VAALANTVPAIDDERQAASAVRVLEQFGLVRQTYGNGPRPVRVRLLARPDRISRELAERPDELQMLRGLWRAARGEPIYRGVELDWRALDGAAGGRARAAPLLDALQDDGFVEWRPLTGEGTWVLDRATPVHKLAVDWRGLEERKRRELGKLRQMQNYAYTEGCRRGYVLRYFGDPAAMDRCGACDNCLGQKPMASVDPADPGDRAMPRRGKVPRADRVRDALLALRRELAARESVPEGMVFGDAVLDALVEARPRRPEALLQVPGVARPLAERYGAGILRAVGGALDQYRERKRGGDAFERAAPAGAAQAAPPNAEQRQLYARLRELRTSLAREEEVPAFCVFADRTLVEIARRHPRSETEMLAVPGVGPGKMQKYGPAFLEILRGG
jgi:ATP-dependent DNA helicase RecQ